MATDPISFFDGSSVSYTYDNGWSFTNTFEGSLRISTVPRRGVLREQVQMVELREGLFLVSWIDEEMGLAAQVLDLENARVITAIPGDEPLTTKVITGRITQAPTL